LLVFTADEIRVRIAAVPLDGAANRALIRFLAERLGVDRSAVAIVGGASARSKAVQVSGVTLEQAANRLGSSSHAVLEAPGLIGPHIELT